MKTLIEESGLTIKEFADYYGIPYNTVLQWSKGIRQAPEYLIKLIKENRELKTNGVQLNITTGRTFNIVERIFKDHSYFRMYEENNEDFERDKDFWEKQKTENYNPNIKTFKVQEIL